jgi:hypothetical protein
VDDAPTTAREKFGTQKAISSDMFFGRNDYDPDALRESQARLVNFQGATSISSNQYFGREEEDELEHGHDGGPLGDGSLSGLEATAREVYGRFISNPDVQNVGESIRAGALKVRIFVHSSFVMGISTDRMRSSRTTLHKCLSVDDSDDDGNDVRSIGFLVQLDCFFFFWIAINIGLGMFLLLLIFI